MMAQTLVEAALEILKTADPVEKARLGEDAAARWLTGTISVPYRSDGLPIPDRPTRLLTVKLVPPQLMPKLGKGGSLRSRQAILHSLVHTESWAIDLSWDIIARFGKQEAMPREFFTDFVKVAQDEGRHFGLLAARLEEIGSFYGAFPAHDGLWDSAMKTSKNLMARLAIEHCVHEARGLDVLPTIISRFRQGSDEPTAELLETVVYPEEITHCSAGVKWFTYLCRREADRGQKSIPSCLRPTKDEAVSKQEADRGQKSIPSCLRPTKDEAVSKQEQDGDGDPVGCHDQALRRLGLEGSGEEQDGDGDPVGCHDQALRRLGLEGSGEDGAVIRAFHATVREYFSGPLKPPFNVEARKAAGFGPEWYEPLSVKEIQISN